MVPWQGIYDWVFLSIKKHLNKHFISKYQHNFFSLVFCYGDGKVTLYLWLVLFLLLLLFSLLFYYCCYYYIMFFPSIGNIDIVNSIVSFICIDIINITGFRWRKCIIRKINIINLLLLEVLGRLLLLYCRL